MIFDCHAHLYPPEFTRNEIRSLFAIKPSVEDYDYIDVSGMDLTVVGVSETLQQAQELLELSQDKLINGKLLPCAGLHPCHITDLFNMHGMQAVRHAVDDIKEFIETDRQSVYAVGEVGLDYCRQTLQQGQEEESCKAAQDYAFIEQIRLATDHSLPLNVHSRQAGHYAIERLRRMNAQRVLMHAFDGSWRYVSQALQAGFYFSIPPSIVRSSTGGGAMNGWVKRVPLDRLLLESDSPALGPVKGERNQPWNCLITARFLASLHGCPLGSILQQTRMNAIKLFGVTNL